MSSRRRSLWRESDFEQWFRDNPVLPSGERVLVIDQHQPIRRMVDLVAIDSNGGLVIIEVKNEASNRQAIGQVLEYLAHFDDATLEDISDDYLDWSGSSLEEEIEKTFGHKISELTKKRRVFLVAPAHDSYSAVAARYLHKNLSGGDITFTLVKAVHDGKSFAPLTPVDPPGLCRPSALGDGLGISPRGRLFRVLDHTSPPIVWAIGRVRDGDEALNINRTSSKRTVRAFRGLLLPVAIPPGSEVSAKDSGSHWKHRTGKSRYATVIGSAVNTAAGAAAETIVCFAEFRGDGFKTFRKQPSRRFEKYWERVSETPKTWRQISELAKARSISASRRKKDSAS